MTHPSRAPLRRRSDPDPRRAADSASLAERLGDALRDERVACLQWKGNTKQARWMSGEGDIDLLVDPTAQARFGAVLDGLGFKRATTPYASRLPAVESFFGHDATMPHLIHVHAHYRLVLGRADDTVFRLPIEETVLDSARQGAVFRVPRPELEVVTFALRLAARFSLRNVMRGDPSWLKSVQPELDSLLARSDQDALDAIVTRHIRCVTPAFLQECIASLRPGYSRWQRLRLARQLRRSLVPHARRAPVTATLQRLWRRVKGLAGLRPAHTGSKQFSHGGSVIALAGGDGAGKTTCTRILADWLGAEFQIMTAHLGRPPRSALTLVVGGILKLARWVRVTPQDDAEGFPGLLQCARDVCTARDRYRLYAKARRFAASGGIALCERHPFPGNYLLAGPRLEPYAAQLEASAVGRRLLATERRYYRDILPPDVAIVLRVDPETAVRRKTTEPADYVRERNRWMWEQDWTGTGAHVLDAGRPLDDVVADLKTLVWTSL
ncbi:MAG TPA: hypothetical protein VI139_04445 [Gemmatimonadales bacterium]